ncbi:hypothetical protein SmJEL517_g01913 [Synchytrium microbalum]|uniref:Alpha N-terminal protein methyltransferase 1 n=1 Tax=Synchytrium microbalum TaxID=1806994 RepID=A0A507C8V8_9FUNG|nr:uncharacterized protein SmJEL517_g01913 [Synchytrium microbalum]TPX35778.1 hypothetical protein SmJEL517_g01913 [Synchytrium microbalum]
MTNEHHAKDPKHHQESWYDDAASYWDRVEPTVDGMLGGFSSLTDIDCRGSIKFIEEYVKPKRGPGGKLISPRLDTKLACDCGAGIGRVSKNFLLKVFDKVDLVEQNPKFLDEGRKQFSQEQVDKYIPLGLQDFVPEAGRYDMIWCQWVLGHLTDDDFIEFFKRCKTGLKPNGLIGVKENTSEADYEIDEVDSSATRSIGKLTELFGKAGLAVVKQAKQNGFPASLFPVYMFILQ